MIRWMRWLFAAFIVAVTAGTVSFTAAQIAENRDLAEHNRHVTAELARIVRHQCEADNAQDAKQIQLWEFIISLTGPAEGDQLGTQQQFRAYINDIFKAQACG